MVQSAGRWMRRCAALVVTGVLVGGLSACAGGNAASGGTATLHHLQAEAIVPASAQDGAIDYTLGSGDKLRVIVFGEKDLSGEFDVTGIGKVSLPLIGQVQASGLTLKQFEEEIADKLREGYLTDPKVSVEVLNFRPFYIIGEVSKPGQYPYTNGMTVLNAVAVSGGFTYRANQDRIFITRGEGAESEYPASKVVKILPGDIVRVPERFF